MWSPEPLDKPLDDEGVARAGQRVHGHAPAAEADPLVVEETFLGAEVSLKNGSYFDVKKCLQMGFTLITEYSRTGRWHIFYCLWLKWAKPGLFFCLFSFFSHDKYSTNTIYDKSIDGVLGTQTQGGRMVGDK